MFSIIRIIIIGAVKHDTPAIKPLIISKSTRIQLVVAIILFNSVRTYHIVLIRCLGIEIKLIVVHTLIAIVVHNSNCVRAWFLKPQKADVEVRIGIIKDILISSIVDDVIKSIINDYVRIAFAFRVTFGKINRITNLNKKSSFPYNLSFLVFQTLSSWKGFCVYSYRFQSSDALASY